MRLERLLLSLLRRCLCATECTCELTLRITLHSTWHCVLQPTFDGEAYVFSNKLDGTLMHVSMKANLLDKILAITDDTLKTDFDRKLPHDGGRAR